LCYIGWRTTVMTVMWHDWWIDRCLIKTLLHLFVSCHRKPTNLGLLLVFLNLYTALKTGEFWYFSARNTHAHGRNYKLLANITFTETVRRDDNGRYIYAFLVYFSGGCKLCNAAWINIFLVVPCSICSSWVCKEAKVCKWNIEVEGHWISVFPVVCWSGCITWHTATGTAQSLHVAVCCNKDLGMFQVSCRTLWLCQWTVSGVM